MHSYRINAAHFRIRVLENEEAYALLKNDTFQTEWAELAAACPWSTACQTWQFADAWLEAYRDLYVPLLLVEHDEAGHLIGLLALAIERTSGAIVHVGAHQAEYQVWLAKEVNAESFIEEALDTLALAYPRQHMRLQYLPPGSPIDWCRSKCRWGARTILHEKTRPLLTLGPESPVEASLRKKSNKSRINRLRKIAPVRLVQVHTRTEFEEVIDSIADYCDLRQGAINSALPFKDDPRKREFCLRLLENPGISHVTVLMVGDTLAAANAGLVNGTSVSLGIVVHSPFVAEHSPGKILILLLARELGRQGFKELDLTPGGDMYKDRSADHHDQVYTLGIFFDQWDYSRHAMRSKLRLLARSIAGRHAGSLASTLRFVARRDLRTLLVEMVRTAGISTFDRKGKRSYTVTLKQTRQVGAHPVFRVNCIPDLLCYEPATWLDPGKSQFLLAASRRLEAGDLAYTLSENGVLLHCAWISRSAVGYLHGNAQEFSDGACILWEEYTHPQAVKLDLSKLSLKQRLHDAAQLPGVSTVTILTSMDEADVYDCCGHTEFRGFNPRVSKPLLDTR